MIALLRNRIQSYKIVNELTNLKNFQYMYTHEFNLDFNDKEKCCIATIHATLKSNDEPTQVFLDVIMKSVLSTDEDLQLVDDGRRNFVFRVTAILQPILENKINKILKFNHLPLFEMPKLSGKIIEIRKPPKIEE